MVELQQAARTFVGRMTAPPLVTETITISPALGPTFSPLRSQFSLTWCLSAGTGLGLLISELDLVCMGVMKQKQSTNLEQM